MNDKPNKVPPGWNDPPTLNYTASNPCPKSRITNKRVAFPLSSGTSTPAPTVGSSEQDLYKKTVDNIDILTETVDNEEFARGFNAMKTMWADGKIPVNIQSILYELSKDLVEGDVTKANEKHLKLMMEGTPVCSAWIGSLRFLINIRKNAA